MDFPPSHTPLLLITGYAQNGSGEEALKLLPQILKVGLQPDEWTLSSVFTACSSLASLEEGKQAHGLVIKCGFESNVSVSNSLITMYSKSGGILDSELAFKQIDSHDLVTWNTMIAAFAQHGLYEKAFAFFNQMRFDVHKPDSITFLSLLSACGHAGKVSESIELFDSMVNNYGISPTSDHYACLVDTVSRSGQLEKACNIILTMPFEADTGIWGALLAACCVYSDVELGELAAKKILDLDPQNSGAYVMLSNIYASARKWRDVTRVRIQMKEQGVKKQRACSWMEVRNKVHIFLRGDISHPDIDKIHLELKIISLHMRAVDDISDVSVWSCFC